MEKRTDSSIAPIEAARGNLKNKLEQDCVFLVIENYKPFNYASFRQFVENMINLTGGEPDKHGTIMSPYIIDNDNKRAIRLSKKKVVSAGLENEYGITICPLSLGLPETERKKAESDLKDASLEEEICVMGDKISKTNAVTYPEEYPGIPFQSYTGGIIFSPAVGGKPIKIGRSSWAKDEEAKAISLKVLEVWQKSQMQQEIPPA